jgi:hypothetical protein
MADATGDVAFFRAMDAARPAADDFFASAACCSGVVDDDRDDQDEQQDGERRPEALVRGPEALGVELVRHDVRVEVATGHRPDDVEHLQGADADGREDHDDRRPDARQRDEAEHPDRGHSVEPGRLDDVVRDRLDRGREDRHGEPGLDPDHHDDEEERVPRRVHDPLLR